MAISDFTINGTPAPDAVEVAEGATVTLALVSTSGVKTIAWTIESSSDDAVSTPTITPAGIPLGATATFTQPSETPFALRVKNTINAGTLTESSAQGIVGTSGASGIIPLTTDEEFARNATSGWRDVVNAMIASINQSATTWTFDTGYLEVSVPDATIKTLYSLDFDTLPGADAIYGAVGRTASGYIEVLVIDLVDSAEGDEETLLFRQRVHRYNGGSVKTDGAQSVDPISNMLSAITLTDGDPMLIRMTKSAAYNSVVKVRVRGELHDRGTI